MEVNWNFDIVSHVRVQCWQPNWYMQYGCERVDT